MSVITTTGALVGDTPDLLKPLSTSFEEIRSTITKELAADPAPDVSCEQIASTTEWLRSIIAAMTEQNSGFSRLGVSQLSDEELQRNQALAREASRQLTVLLAENTKQFRAEPMGTVMAFGKGSQSQEVRQNLATFRQFWDKFGDAKWLSGLVAPEFAEKKELAKKLLDKLQGMSQGGQEIGISKSVTLYDQIAGCNQATSKSKLMRLAQMADLLAQACREDAEAMEDAEKQLEKKMDLLKDEVDCAHMQLEEFRDEAAEERVMRRVGQKRALSEGSWSLASPR
ncbi:ADAMTS9 [Symbiodinium microadriaticum]|nr:ADAMTS9 [Symbiodinium microadriaticum]